MKEQFITKFLGEDFWEKLEKSNELFKLGTQTALNIEEIRVGLKVVPRFVMSFLIQHLIPMQVGEQKEIFLPFGENSVMSVNKGDTDSYSGSVRSANKPVYDFRNRSVPGIGIILLSTFELYDMKELEQEEKYSPNVIANVQKMIDEKIEQRMLIEKIVDQKISEREAIQKLMMAKLSEALKPVVSVPPPMAPSPSLPIAAPIESAIHVGPQDIIKKEHKTQKGSPLKQFLERKKPKEFAIKMEKSETVDCPDCQQTIFGKTGYSGCICMGADQHRKIWLKKTEDGIKIRFSKGWDEENMEMLLQVLRGKHD